jgi:GWxTD domain-containing protein
MALLYNPVQSDAQPEVKVYHQNGNISKVYVRVYKKDIAFVADSNGLKYAQLDIYAKLFKGINMSFLQDSVKKQFIFYQQQTPDTIQYEFEFTLEENKDYFLEIDIDDRVRNSHSQYFKEIEKNNLWSEDDFIIFNKSNQSFENFPFLLPNNTYTIQTSYLSPSSGYLYYINSPIPLAYPPFYLKTIPDYKIKAQKHQVLNYANGFDISVSKAGIYHLQPDSAPTSGLTLYYFNDFYPKVKTPEAMASALRYLVSKNEYQKIIYSNNIKAAVDSFWLTHSNDMAVASSLIREYYSRVQKANTYFSSFTEGWRTDRGMIYIIIGPPTNVFVYKDREVWRYGARMSLNYTEFIFWKIDNPFSDNHYLLERKLNYKPLWYEATGKWRSGEIYRYQN